MTFTTKHLWGGMILLALIISLPVVATAKDIVVVPLKPLQPVEDATVTENAQFPTGWAVINRAKGDVHIFAILPANRRVPVPDCPCAGIPEIPPEACPCLNRPIITGATMPPDIQPEVVFEGWLVDFARPQPCPPPVDIHMTAEPILFGKDIIGEGTAEEEVCGNRNSSETVFRGFPGIPSRAFESTYFPASQGLLKPTGRALGDWQFYVGQHKTNMGLKPFDLVVVTAEPPMTGAPNADYDPRPNPIITLIGRIPMESITPPPTDPGANTGGPNPPPQPPVQRRVPAKPVVVR